MARCQVRGVDLDVEVSGVGIPTLVWGHGLTSNREHENRGALLDWTRFGNQCTTVRYDARGHGRSDTSSDPTTFSWRSLAEDQLALADALGIERYVAAGASMGCGTALHAAVLAPHRVQALILAIPPTAWESRQERVAIWAQMADLVERRGIDALIESSAAIPPPDPLVGRHDVLDENERNLRETDPHRLAAVFRGAGHADLPARDDVAAIMAPTLILAWTGDTGHPVSTAQQLCDLMPHAELVVAGTADELSTWTDLANGFIARVAADA